MGTVNLPTPGQRIEELQAENAQLREELKAASNLLAVIHSDGGHYQDKHGFVKACADAETSACREREQLSTAQLDAARYRNHCRNKQIAAWMGLDPNASDALEQLDAAIDAAIEKGEA